MDGSMCQPLHQFMPLLVGALTHILYTCQINQPMSRCYTTSLHLNHRPTQHEWVLTQDEILKQRDLTQTVEEMKKFNAKRKFRAAAGAVSHWSMFLFLLVHA